MTRTAKKHETDGVAHINVAAAELRSAVAAAEHGEYGRAHAVVRDARDRLYLAEIELRKAEVLARRST